MKGKTRRRMTAKQVTALKAQLLARRSRLLRGIHSQLGALRQSREHGVSDTADIATDAQQDFESLRLAEFEVQELRKIEGAIRRIDSGTFDICEECDGPIGQERLRALPYATLCVRCQQRLEAEGAGAEPEEHWGGVVEAEEELERSVRVPDERLDGVERRY
jgi:DnaK suppressor protein